MSGFVVGDLVILNPVISGVDEGPSLAIITAIEPGYFWVLDGKGFNRPVHKSWIRQLGSNDEAR